MPWQDFADHCQDVFPVKLGSIRASVQYATVGDQGRCALDPRMRESSLADQRSAVGSLRIVSLCLWHAT